MLLLQKHYTPPPSGGQGPLGPCADAVAPRLGGGPAGAERTPVPSRSWVSPLLTSPRWGEGSLGSGGEAPIGQSYPFWLRLSHA
jgi:hypothetical protein